VVVAERPELGERLATDERVRVLSFTGSDKVGWRLKRLANTKRVTLELGGNAAVAVHEDADLDFAVRRCVTGAFANAGQVCISVQRLYVHRPIFDDFCARFVDGARALRLGDPHDEATDLGPLITDAAADQIETWVREAIDNGARALLRGERVAGTRLLGPTILTNTTPDMAVACNETFGPVVCIEPYDEWDEALARMNAGRYGLQAGVLPVMWAASSAPLRRWRSAASLPTTCPCIGWTTCPTAAKRPAASAAKACDTRSRR
jgi:acyl-CoA reductase-like NAD-dependent aldehyde dehydrogenase